MAVRAASLCKSLHKSFQKLSIVTSIQNPVLCQKYTNNGLLHTNNIFTSTVRNTSFFNKSTAEFIWKSVTSVSNAGRKKGRGKAVGKKRTKDLNKGQIIGSGKINMVWPGLTTAVIRGHEVVKQQQLPEDPERMAKILKFRDSVGGFRFLKLAPLERGWSGTKMPGRSLGPPDAVGDDHFEGFDSKCLEFKSLLLMRGSLGRTRRMSAMVVTGNGNGLAGFAIGKGREGQAALRKARNRAGQKLIHFDLYNGHTVFHDFFTQFGKTKIFVNKKAEGYGLECHRAIKCICQMIGIKDLHAKVEGSSNLQHIVKAFFLGLLQQKSHQQLAEEKQLNLVEFRRENGNFPRVVAKPETVRTAKQIKNNEVLDFTQYALDDRVVLKRKKAPPFYTRLPHWELHLRKQEKHRNHNTVRHNLLTEYDKLTSFLNEKYPDPIEEKES